MIITVICLPGCSDSGGSSKTTTYKLQTTVKGEGSVTPSNGSYKKNKEITLKAIPEKNWGFKKWKGSIRGNKNPKSIIMTGDMSVTTVFKKIEHPLNINIEGKGSVKKKLISTTSSTEYKSGSKVKLTPKPNEGWYFDHWEGSITGNRTPMTVIIDKKKAITTVFFKTGTLKGNVTVSNKTKWTVPSENEFYTQAQDIQLPKGRINNSNLQINKNKLIGSNKEYKRSEIIVKYKSLVTSQSIQNMALMNNLKIKRNFCINNEKLVHYQIKGNKTVREAVKKYNSFEIVEYAEPNYIYHATSVPSDPYYDEANNKERVFQWAPINANMEAAWDQETGNSETTVAVIDSGVIIGHPDLDSNLSNNGYDFVDEDDYPFDLTLKSNGGSHGTHVAGIIGAKANNAKGIAGVNWNVNILPIRVLNASGIGYNADITAGINYAVDNGADIINLSLGGGSYSEAMYDAIKNAVNNGVVVIAASGNQGSDEILYPARYDNTIAVGAVGSNNKRSNYSNYGSNLDLVAPGGAGSDKNGMVLSTWGYIHDNDAYWGYNWMKGTSMAAPYVSGVAGLLDAQGLNSDEIISRLKNTAVDLGPPGKDNKYGYGLVDAYGALIGKKLKNPRVFAATRNGDTLRIESQIKQVKNNGDYTLNNVKSKELYLIGWRDVNGNNEIDGGDYYGEAGPIDVTPDSINNLDLNMNYIGSSSSQANFEIKGMEK